MGRTSACVFGEREDEISHADPKYLALAAF